MKRDIRFTVKVDIRKAKRKHRPHESGAGEHDSTPKRERTRERSKSRWRKDLEE
jgi:hypothetical protein